MRFCTANLIQSINLPIQILIVHQIEMDIEEEIAVAYLLIRRMRKNERKRKAAKQVGQTISSKMRRKRGFCTF